MTAFYPWSLAALADVAAGRLRAACEQADAQQAVYGVDSLDELRLHPLLHEGFRQAGFGVWPEQRYPGHWHKSRFSQGLRCDMVLTPDGLPLREPRVEQTLFGQLPGCDAGAAFWLEVKTVAQFEHGRPFTRYSSELLASVPGDVKKLAEDTQICHAGLLIILFTQDQRVAEHDLAAWHNHCLERGLAVQVPAIRGFDITDRVGNGWCSVALFGTG